MHELYKSSITMGMLSYFTNQTFVSRSQSHAIFHMILFITLKKFFNTLFKHKAPLRIKGFIPPPSGLVLSIFAL